MANRLVVDCTTGAITLIPLTPQEESELTALHSAAQTSADTLATTQAGRITDWAAFAAQAQNAVNNWASLTANQKDTAQKLTIVAFLRLLQALGIA